MKHALSRRLSLLILAVNLVACAAVQSHPAESASAPNAGASTSNAAASAASSTPSSAGAGASMTLVRGQQKTPLPDTSISFDQIEDSRCKKNVQCVWAGALNYRFTLSAKTGTESFALSELRPRFDSARQPGLSVTLKSAPAPGNAGDPPSEAPVTLQVDTHN